MNMRFRTTDVLGAISVFLVVAACPAALAQSDRANGSSSFTAQIPAVDQPGHREWTWTGTDALNYGGSGHVRYEPGGAPRIIVTGDPDEVANIEVDGGVIRRRETPGLNFSHGNVKLEILVQGVNLDRFTMAGSGSMELGRLQRDTLSLRVEGSGALDVQGQAAHLDLKLDGSGRADLGQLSAGDAKIAINGSGAITTAAISGDVGLRIAGSGKAMVGDVGKTADIAIAGSGLASLGRVETVTTKITGSGTVQLGSQPQQGTYNVLGSGKVVLIGPDGKVTELARMRHGGRDGDRGANSRN
jgi:hypothetical protein